MVAETANFFDTIRLAKRESVALPNERYPVPATPKKSSAAKPAAKPARKGNVRTSNGKAAPVRSRKLSASEKKSGVAKLAKPTARRAAPKPTAKRAAPKVGTTAATERDAKAVAKLRAKGIAWSDIAASTGFSLSRLARLRKFGKANGIAGFGA